MFDKFRRKRNQESSDIQLAKELDEMIKWIDELIQIVTTFRDAYGENVNHWNLVQLGSFVAEIQKWSEKMKE